VTIRGGGSLRGRDDPATDQAHPLDDDWAPVVPPIGGRGSYRRPSRGTGGGGVRTLVRFLLFSLVLAAIVLGGVLFSRWKSSVAGRVSFDGLLLRIPLIGPILRQFALSQFSRSLATLVGAGTPLVPALDIAANAVANQRVSGAVAAVVPRVREGAELWRSLESTGVFTSLAVEMIKVGEATGALEEMLTNTSDFYDEAIDAQLQRIVSLIEPIILVVMGGVVATLLLSIYLPMFTILSNIRA